MARRWVNGSTSRTLKRYSPTGSKARHRRWAIKTQCNKAEGRWIGHISGRFHQPEMAICSERKQRFWPLNFQEISLRNTSMTIGNLCPEMEKLDRKCRDCEQLKQTIERFVRKIDTVDRTIDAYKDRHRQL